MHYLWPHLAFNGSRLWELPALISLELPRAENKKAAEQLWGERNALNFSRIRGKNKEYNEAFTSEYQEVIPSKSGGNSSANWDCLSAQKIIFVHHRPGPARFPRVCGGIGILGMVPVGLSSVVSAEVCSGSRAAPSSAFLVNLCKESLQRFHFKNFLEIRFFVIFESRRCWCHVNNSEQTFVSRLWCLCVNVLMNKIRHVKATLWTQCLWKMPEYWKYWF